jgi:hypothetical protein
MMSHLMLPLMCTDHHAPIMPSIEPTSKGCLLAPSLPLVLRVTKWARH